MKGKNLLLLLILGGIACNKKNYNNGYGSGTPTPPTDNYGLFYLVAGSTGFGSEPIDPTLLNPWGIAVNPAQGAVWIASNHGGVSNVYDGTGKTLIAPVPIPAAGTPTGGSPTGIVFNSTPDFAVPGATTATKFIFVSEDGIVSAWPLSAASASKVVDRSSANAVYKGCAIASDAGANYLYAANFKGGTIDVFDRSFNLVTGRDFKDPNIPAGYAPFNISNIGGKLYVTYAKQKGPDNDDDERGLGNGYVDIYAPDGKLVKNFASKGALNSPWGIAQVPDGFGIERHSILVGNFGDGWINIYDSTGAYKGPLKNGGENIAIDGLWALDFPVNEFPQADPTQLYFTAGPTNEQFGLFGYLKKQ